MSRKAQAGSGNSRSTWTTADLRGNQQVADAVADTE
jgi:hypothetical protein